MVEVFMPFKKAQRRKLRGRILLAGVSGSGKTYSALRIASGFAEATGGRIAVIDTEEESALRYADMFDFDHLGLANHSVDSYIDAFNSAHDAGYGILVVDSTSHEWRWLLNEVDRLTAAARGGSSFYNGWSKATPMHDAFVQSLVRWPGHVIATARSKAEYLEVDKGGKKQLEKQAAAPVQRDGLEYEFDLSGDLDLTHTLNITKSRYAPFADQMVQRPDERWGRQLAEWLDAGLPAVLTAAEVNDLQARLAEYPPDALDFLKRWTAENDVPGLRSGELTSEHRVAVLKAIDNFAADPRAAVDDLDDAAEERYAEQAGVLLNVRSESGNGSGEVWADPPDGDQPVPVPPGTMELVADDGSAPWAPLEDGE